MSLNDPHWGRGGSDDNEEKRARLIRKTARILIAKMNAVRMVLRIKRPVSEKMKGMIWIVSGMNLTVLWAEC